MVVPGGLASSRRGAVGRRGPSKSGLWRGFSCAQRLAQPPTAADGGQRCFVACCSRHDSGAVLPPPLSVGRWTKPLRGSLLSGPTDVSFSPSSFLAVRNRLPSFSCKPVGKDSFGHDKEDDDDRPQTPHGGRSTTPRDLAPKSQQRYVDAVKQLAQHYRRSPDQLSEEEIRQYFLFLINEKKVAESTFRIHLYEIKFLYETTLQQHCIPI
jgi:Phage integrase, N-terminal SAM-like domain